MYVFEETRTSTTGQTQTQLNPKQETEMKKSNQTKNGNSKPKLSKHFYINRNFI